jgi:small-conductance mechanosensitive channel
MSSHLIRSDLIPVVTGYVLLMAVLAAGLWSARRRVRTGRPLTRYTGQRDSGWLAFVWHVLADAVGGYLLLAAVVVLYYYLVARVRGNFLDSAFSGSGLLLGVSLPVFLICSWLSLRRRDWRPERDQRTDRARPDKARNGPDGSGPPAA